MRFVRDMTWSSRRLAGFGSAWPSIALVALLATAALVPLLRPFLLMALLLAYGLARWRTVRTGRLTTMLAAALPVAAILAWGSLLQPIAAAGDCTDPLAPPAAWRFLEALVGIVAVAALVIDRRGTWAELGLRIGSRRNVLVAVAGFLVAVPVALSAGGVLLTAHDLHEAPWGLGQQLNQLIKDGYVGDGVLLPEPLSEHLPVVGRGAATWKVTDWAAVSAP